MLKHLYNMFDHFVVIGHYRVKIYSVTDVRLHFRMLHKASALP